MVVQIESEQVRIAPDRYVPPVGPEILANAMRSVFGLGRGSNPVNSIQARLCQRKHAFDDHLVGGAELAIDRDLVACRQIAHVNPE